MAWGVNDGGQLGDGTTTTKLAPVQVSGLGPGSGVSAIATKFNHTLAVKSDGALLAWGLNANGQLGDGTTTNRLTPVQVTGFGPGSGVAALATAASHTMAVKSDGTVWVWGVNANGQLGDGTTSQRNVPVQLTGLSGVVAVSASPNRSFESTWALPQSRFA